MGEAKRRGNLESRQAAGVIKRIRAAQERAQRLAEIEAAMTPEQKAKRARGQALLTGMIGLAASSGFVRRS